MLSAFEKLPAELRIRIYEEVLPSGKFLVPCLPKMRYGLYPATRISAILATNRNIHADAGAYLYGNNIVDLDSTFSGHVGHPTSIWRRFGPCIQHVEISATRRIAHAYHALSYARPLEIEELEYLWQWKKNLIDAIASTGLKTLAIDMKACAALTPWNEEKSVVALPRILESLMKNVVVERLTLRWTNWDDDGILYQEETTESQDKRRGDRKKSVVKHLTIHGSLDIMVARMALSVLGR